MNAGEGGGEKGKEREREEGVDTESQMGDTRSSFKERRGNFQRSMMSMGTRLVPPNIFSGHQDQVSWEVDFEQRGVLMSGG